MSAGAAAPAAQPPAVVKKPRNGPVVLTVLRVNTLQLLSIDHLAQTFTARYFVPLRIKGGAHDPDLLLDINDEKPPFPKEHPFVTPE